MRRNLKLIAALIAAVTAMTCTAAAASAEKLKTTDGVTYRYSDSGERIGTYTGWQTGKGGARYYCKNGVKLRNKWLKVGGKRAYYFLDDGSAVRGTVVIGGKVYSFTGGGNDAGRYISSDAKAIGITVKAKKVTGTGLTLAITRTDDKYDDSKYRVVVPYSCRLAKKTESGWELLERIGLGSDTDVDDEVAAGTSERKVKLGKNGLEAGRYMLIAEAEVFDRKNGGIADTRMCHVTFTVK